MFGSFLPGLWLVGTLKVHPALGADIVMESITPTAPAFSARGGCVVGLVTPTILRMDTLEGFPYSAFRLIGAYA